MRLLVLCPLLLAAAAQLDAKLPWSGAQEQMEDFLSVYCIDCHDDADPKGNHSLEDFEAIAPDQWHRIYGQLASGEMPPQKKKQPSLEERERIITLL